MYMNNHVLQNPSCQETGLLAEGVCVVGDCQITQMPTDETLHKVPCVQFSLSNDNTVLSELVDRAVNVIADSVGSVFSTIYI